MSEGMRFVGMTLEEVARASGVSLAPAQGSGDFSIGSAVWPGISKLLEECGELTQVAGKLLGSGGATRHWDGTDLRQRLEEELADLEAAILFLKQHNELDTGAIAVRVAKKLALFNQWHRAPAPLPAPPSEEPQS